jgi:outer membrane protein assembly factor BamB
LDGSNGTKIWREDLLTRIGVTPKEDLQAIAWGRANSPLMVDSLVVVPLGGPLNGPCVSLAAFDKDTGRLAWTGGSRQASFSSPCLATIGGQRQILVVNQDYVSGHQPETGEVLWEHPWPGVSNGNANVSQGVPLPDDRLLLSKGYHGGAKLLHLTRDASGKWQTTEVWAKGKSLLTKFSNVVVHENHAYGISDGILECVDLATGRRQWKAGRYGQGQILGVDDLLIVQAESGEVALVEATPIDHRQLGSFVAIDGKTWNNPCLYGHFLLVRNAQKAACYELP